MTDPSRDRSRIFKHFEEAYSLRKQGFSILKSFGREIFSPGICLKLRAAAEPGQAEPGQSAFAEKRSLAWDILGIVMKGPVNDGVVTPCPKCGFLLEPGAAECQVCGIVISRYLDRHAELGGGDPPPPVPRNRLFGLVGEGEDGMPPQGQCPSLRERSLSMLLDPTPRNCNLPMTFLHALLLVTIAYLSMNAWIAPIESNQAGTTFMHLVNLPFHEAGHVIFRPFGEFITSLGGTLGQLLVPLICLGAFIFYRFDNYAAAVCLWWTGENFLDIAPYINDARSGTLPLIGGNTGRSAPYGFHDWEYLLTETGLLGYDHQLARAAALAGTALMSAALVWAGILVWRQFRNCRG